MNVKMRCAWNEIPDLVAFQHYTKWLFDDIATLQRMVV
jgi:hypothetical protein